MMRRIGMLLAALGVWLVLLACQDLAALPAATVPRWACPSPTAQPTRVKEVVPLPTTTPGVDPGVETIYTAPYEAEYGLPLRTPTPYGIAGTRFVLGQQVEIAPIYVQVSVEAVPQGVTETLQIVTLRWHNPTGAAIPMDYGQRVLVRAIRQPNGAITSGDTWGISAAAVRQSGLAPPDDVIPAGDSVTHIPILTPPGEAEIVEVRFRQSSAATPTAESEPTFLAVQWVWAEPDPPCAEPGVTTAWGDGPAAIPQLVAPPGSARVVEIALQQVGKPYIWGAKGPSAFDCSGLTEWSYAQIGIDIPTGTSGQWPRLPAVADGALQSGDLLFFDTATGRRQQITHVGFAADLDADGDWDMVHAASPEYGVRIDEDVFTRPYYVQMYMGARTVPGR